MTLRLLGRSLALAAAALVVCCATARPARTASRGRALLLSFDGLGGVRLGQLLEAGKLPAGGFQAFATRGVIAGRAITTTPSQTSVAHASAITGKPPSRTGIVGNVFHRAGEPLGTTASGFTTEIGSETLWEAAMRQGKRVGVLVYPGADGVTRRRVGSFGFMWPREPLHPSAVLRVPPESWKPSAAEGATKSASRSDPVSAEGATKSFSPVQEASVDVDGPYGPIPLRLLALDTSDDGTTNYDLVRVSRVAEPPVELRPNGWFRLGAPPSAEGTWGRLVALDPRLAKTVFYVGRFYGVPAYPDDYQRRVEAELGPWPGQPDPVFLRGIDGVKDEAAYEEQSLRLSAYLERLLLFTIRTERWDLLIHYQPAIDEVEHAFERTIAEDVEGPPVRSGDIDERIERAFAGADRELARILAALRPDDSVFVHSDHGMAPVERSIDLEGHLEARGWHLVRSADDGASARPSLPHRLVQVCAASGIAHLYLPRDPAGNPAPEDLAALRRDVESLEGEPGPRFDAVLQKSGLGSLGLDHPNAGDLVLLLPPGSIFEHRRGGPLDPSLHRGAHGYRNVFPILDASYLALGPTVRQGHPESVSLLDLAGAVARALGIDVPRS